jgi:hypothetical protein
MRVALHLPLLDRLHGFHESRPRLKKARARAIAKGWGLDGVEASTLPITHIQYVGSSPDRVKGTALMRRANFIALRIQLIGRLARYTAYPEV